MRTRLPARALRARGLCAVLCPGLSGVGPCLAAPLAGRGRFLRGGGALGGGPGGGGSAALLPALAAEDVGVLLAPAAARLVAAPRLLVHGGPGPALRLLFGDAPPLVAVG